MRPHTNGHYGMGLTYGKQSFGPTREERLAELQVKLLNRRRQEAINRKNGDFTAMRKRQMQIERITKEIFRLGGSIGGNHA